MSYKTVDMSDYPRKSHFEYFLTYANPYMGMTVNVDVGELKRETAKRGESFFFACLYAASRALNGIPEFRRRIANGGIIEYDNCPTSHTVALPDGTYCYCSLKSDMPYESFLKYAKEKQEQAKSRHGIPADEDETELIFVSCIPWQSYTALVQPTPYPADSNPRVTFGKYFESENRLLMPVSLLVNHALADGLHVAKFFEGFASQCRAIYGEK